MNQELQKRLDEIPARLESDEFLNNKGLGNEIGFHIFDYEPEDELQVRAYIEFFMEHMKQKHPNLKFAHINLFHTLCKYLEVRGLLEKAIKMQIDKGDDSVIKALQGPLHMDKFSLYLVESIQPQEHDVIMISGVGSVWPLLRIHNLLNSLHAKLGFKPLVIFYPGTYSGLDLNLFGKVVSNNYYRAFKLVP